MASREEMVKRLSGGAAESNPNNALGGVMSSVQIDSQSAVYVGGGIAGVTLAEGLGHQIEGDGNLDFDFATGALTWTPFGGSVGPAVVVSGGDARYLIEDAVGNQYVLVDVVSASLPGSDTDDDVTIGNIPQNLFNLIAGTEAALGSVKYRCYYILNDAGAGDALNVKLWITRQPAVSNTLIAVGLDPVGIGDGSATGVATTIANEDTAPAGVSFTTPVTEGTALMIGNLQPGEVQAIWIRRTVQANELNEDPDDPSEITHGVSF